MSLQGGNDEKREIIIRNLCHHVATIFPLPLLLCHSINWLYFIRLECDLVICNCNLSLTVPSPSESFTLDTEEGVEIVRVSIYLFTEKVVLYARLRMMISGSQTF